MIGELALASAALVGLVGLMLGDAATGATIAGVFSVMNTVLMAILNRRVKAAKVVAEDTNRILRAPRKMIFDNQGKPIGTMLHLDGGDELVHAFQRADDPQPPPLQSSP